MSPAMAITIQRSEAEEAGRPISRSGVLTPTSSQSSLNTADVFENRLKVDLSLHLFVVYVHFNRRRKKRVMCVWPWHRLPTRM